MTRVMRRFPIGILRGGGMIQEGGRIEQEGVHVAVACLGHIKTQDSFLHSSIMIVRYLPNPFILMVR